MARPVRPRPKFQPSSVDKLDKEIRELIGQLRIDKGWTIDEIKQQLEKMGQGHISRSALGRHVRQIADVASEMKEVKVYADALAKEAGDSDLAKLADLNAQMLQTNMFKLMLAAKDGEGIQLSPKDSKDFADALRSIALTRKTELDVIEKAEERSAKKATKEAAENATKAARAKGLSQDTVDAIRMAVLGSDQ